MTEVYGGVPPRFRPCFPLTPPREKSAIGCHWEALEGRVGGQGGGLVPEGVFIHGGDNACVVHDRYLVHSQYSSPISVVVYDNTRIGRLEIV